MVIEKVDFDLNLGQIAQQSSQIIADKVFTNDSDHEEAVPFEVTHHAEETSLFEHGDGFIIEPNTAFKSACLIEMNGPDFLTPYNLGGIPFLTDGKIEVGLLRTNKFQTPEKTSKNYKANFTIIVPSKSQARARATLLSALLTVPYTITLHLKRDHSVKIQAKGIWTGLSYNLDYTYQIPTNEHPGIPAGMCSFSAH